MMDLALQDRPAWTEVVAVLAACALLLVAVVKLDHTQASRENERARVALAERAREERANPTAKASVPAAPAARTESLGDRGPITIPIGGAWGAGTASAVSNGTPSEKVEPAPTPELRRIMGPSSTPAAWQDDRPSPPARTAASPAKPVGGDPLLFVVAGLGAFMALGGALILGRSR